MSFSLHPAADYSNAALADLFNRSFEDYFVSFDFTEDFFAHWAKRDEIDLQLSRVILHNNDPIGLALIASRGGDESRLGGMGIIKDFRGKGAGAFLVEALLTEARARGEKCMLLEVIAQNTPAICLYEKFGFKTIRHLPGFVAEKPKGETNTDLKACEIALVIEKVEKYGLPNLPWQIDLENLKKNADTAFGYSLAGSYIAVSDPEQEHIVLRMLVSEKEAQGGKERLLKTLFAKYPGKIWHVPPVFPEEQAHIFKNVGMTKEDISQWQMVVEL